MVNTRSKKQPLLLLDVDTSSNNPRAMKAPKPKNEKIKKERFLTYRSRIIEEAKKLDIPIDNVRSLNKERLTQLQIQIDNKTIKNMAIRASTDTPTVASTSIEPPAVVEEGTKEEVPMMSVRRPGPKRKGFQTNEFRAIHTDKKVYTGADIKKMVGELKKNNPDIKGHDIMITSYHEDVGWHSGVWTGYDSELSIFTIEHVNYFGVSGGIESVFYSEYEMTDFVIYTRTPQTTGGADENNSCLFNLLKYKCALVNNTDIDTDEKLKQYLGLKNNDMIPVSMIDKIEDIYKVSIDIRDVRNSEKKYAKKLHLSLTNNHYQRIDSDNIERYGYKELTHKYKYPRPIVSYKILPDGIEIYNDEKGKRIMEKNEFFRYIKNVVLRQADEDETVEENWDSYKELRNKLLPTNVELFAFKSIGECAEAHWRDTLTTEFQPVNSQQDDILNKCLRGGFVYCRNKDKDNVMICDNAIALDVNSMYAYLLQSSRLFPISGGNIRTKDEANIIINNAINQYNNSSSDKERYTALATVGYGFYKVEIDLKENPPRFSKSDYYSHWDIKSMISHGYTFKSIGNAITWNKNELVAGSSIFKKFVMRFIDERYKKGIKEAKTVINTLWGYLCRKNKIKKNVQYEYELDDDEDIIEMSPSKYDNLLRITTKNAKKHTFISPVPYIGVLLTAMGRDYIQTMIDICGRGNVVRVHTDGIIINCSLNDNIKKLIGVEIGKLKIEACGKLEIKHANSYVIRNQNNEVVKTTY